MLSAFSKVSQIVSFAIGMMSAVEKIYGAIKGQGSKKKEAYIEGLMAALGATEELLGKDFVNDARFKALAGQLADVVIGIYNLIETWKKEKGIQ